MPSKRMYVPITPGGKAAFFGIGPLKDVQLADEHEAMAWSKLEKDSCSSKAALRDQGWNVYLFDVDIEEDENESETSAPQVNIQITSEAEEASNRVFAVVRDLEEFAESRGIEVTVLIPALSFYTGWAQGKALLPEPALERVIEAVRAGWQLQRLHIKLEELGDKKSR